MKKIEKNLALTIKKVPQKAYKIVLVFDPEKRETRLKHPALTKIMHNILSGTLTGHEIIELSKSNAVVSIEPDSEMYIF